jgi:hypothetical protein
MAAPHCGDPDQLHKAPGRHSGQTLQMAARSARGATRQRTLEAARRHLAQAGASWFKQADDLRAQSPPRLGVPAPK